MLYQASYSKVVIPPKMNVWQPSRIQTSTKKDSWKTNHGYSGSPNQRTEVIMETWRVSNCSHDQSWYTDTMESEIRGFFRCWNWYVKQTYHPWRKALKRTDFDGSRWAKKFTMTWKNSEGGGGRRRSIEMGPHCAYASSNMNAGGLCMPPSTGNMHEERRLTRKIGRPGELGHWIREASISGTKSTPHHTRHHKRTS